MVLCFYESMYCEKVPKKNPEGIVDVDAMRGVLYNLLEGVNHRNIEGFDVENASKDWALSMYTNKSS